jgi:hypothetical protein
VQALREAGLSDRRQEEMRYRWLDLSVVRRKTDKRSLITWNQIADTRTHTHATYCAYWQDSEMLGQSFLGQMQADCGAEFLKRSAWKTKKSPRGLRITTKQTKKSLQKKVFPIGCGSRRWHRMENINAISRAKVVAEIERKMRLQIAAVMRSEVK